MIARREIDVVARVAAGGGAHVLGVERVLEREHDAVHRHGVEVGVPPVKRVEFGGAFERVGQLAEHLAHRRRAGRQWSLRRMTVELAAAGDRPLATDVERGQRVQLPGIGDAGDHAVLLLNRGIGGSRLHAAEFERLAAVLVEVRQDGRGPDGRGREAERRQRTHRTPGLRDRRTVFGDEHTGNAVIGPRALDVVLDNRDAIRLARAYRPVQLLDRRLLKTKWRIGGVPLVRHVLGPSSSGHGVYIRHAALWLVSPSAPTERSARITTGDQVAENLTPATAPASLAKIGALSAWQIRAGHRTDWPAWDSVRRSGTVRRFHSHFHRMLDGDRHRTGVDPDQCAAGKPRVNVVVSGKFTTSDMVKARSDAGVANSDLSSIKSPSAPPQG